MEHDRGSNTFFLYGETYSLQKGPKWKTDLPYQICKYCILAFPVPFVQLASVDIPVVEVWGKAAIGSYLWQHILEGEESLDETMPGATVGELRMPAFVLRYRSGKIIHVKKCTLFPMIYITLVIILC